MPSYRKSDFITLPVYINSKGERTLESVSLVTETIKDETTGEDKTVKSYKENEKLLNKDGDHMVNPMNRHTRRMMARLSRQQK